MHPLLPSGKPDYSRVVPCRCNQDAVRKEKLGALERLSNLGVLSRLTFANLSPQGRRGDEASQRRFARAYEAAKEFAAEPRGWLVLMGPPGSGKTHVACAVANHRLGLGEPVVYTAAADLLDHLRRAFEPDTEIPYDELIEQVKNAPLLILDDLNPETATPWSRDKLEQILNHRFNRRLPTIVTTDVPTDRLDERLRARVNDREVSRLFVLEDRRSAILDELDAMGQKLLRGMTFQNFERRRLDLPPEQQQSLAEAYNFAFNFARVPQGWLVLQGESGCGKTHLAAAIANFLLQAGKQVVFVSVGDLLDHLRAAFSPESRVSHDELFDTVKRVPLLILDGLEGQTTTSWAQEKLYQLLNYRYVSQLPTVITTRLDLEDMDGRIGSRMADPRLNTALKIDAPSYHPLKHSGGPGPARRRPRRPSPEE